MKHKIKIKKKVKVSIAAAMIFIFILILLSLPYMISIFQNTLNASIQQYNNLNLYLSALASQNKNQINFVGFFKAFILYNFSDSRGLEEFYKSVQNIYQTGLYGKSSIMIFAFICEQLFIVFSALWVLDSIIQYSFVLLGKGKKLMVLGLINLFCTLAYAALIALWIFGLKIKLDSFINKGIYWTVLGLLIGQFVLIIIIKITAKITNSRNSLQWEQTSTNYTYDNDYLSKLHNEDTQSDYYI
ncbi:hypothetical protein [Mycoplasmopsis adleri]|uniref:hypothetical protein n=1 Tax=Mycoplasmopsis adleri TaxID=51362 RepID=UPI0038735EDE